MRILPRSFSDEFVLDYATVPLTTPAARRQQAGATVSGKDGSWYLGTTDLVGGDDANDAFRGRNKYEVLREMRSDAAVKSLEYMVCLPVRAASWKLDPASEDAADQAVADCVAWQFGLGECIPGRKHMLGRMVGTWRDSVAQALLAVPYGAMGEELIWGDAELWDDADGDPHLIRPLERLAPRMASTVIDYDVDPRTGGILWVEQDLPGATRIPGDKLAWYAIGAEAGDIWGTSFLRAAYGPWKMKRALTIAAAVGWDRFSSGVPVVRYPTGPSNQQRAEAIGRNWRGHERAWVTFEGPKDQGWDIEIKGSDGTLPDPTNLLRWYDEQIAKSGLQQFSSLGTTQTGSRAVGEVLADPFYLAVQTVAEDLASARMRQVIRRFIDMNFGADVAMPELQVSDVAVEDTEKLARTLSDLSSAGLSFTDADTVNDVRRRLKLRELPEGVATAVMGLPDQVGVSANAPQPLPPGTEGSSIAPPARMA